MTRAWGWMANLKIDFNLEGESNRPLSGIPIKAHIHNAALNRTATFLAKEIWSKARSYRERRRQ